MNINFGVFSTSSMFCNFIINNTMIFKVKSLKPRLLLTEIDLKTLLMILTKFYRKSADGFR